MESFVFASFYTSPFKACMRTPIENFTSSIPLRSLVIECVARTRKVCMSSRIIGILLLVGGVALLVGGYIASQSATESVRSFLGFKFGKETMWYILGGATAVISGLLVMMGRY